MFSTCMFCNRPLGANQVVEHFPVGRRLAFDAERGRLWVVCRKCERWNLTPLEERWEAVETCEQLFRDTRTRTSTENVGLAKHREGLELVRIGRPLRPEFAAWRYGDQFGRRRRRAIFYGAGATVMFGGVAVGGAIAVPAVGAGFAGSVFLDLLAWWTNHRTVVRLRTDDGRAIKLSNADLGGTILRRAEEGRGFYLALYKGKAKRAFEGEEAERLIGKIMPKINRKGGTKPTITAAVAQIERSGHPDKFLTEVLTGNIKDVKTWPRPTKLALEMALHEEQERRALEGELWRLERAWKEAEELAAIADDLLLPQGTDEFIGKHRGGTVTGE